MTASLLPLSLMVALGSALTITLVMSHGSRPGAQPAPTSHRPMNCDIERRLDLVVNGPSMAPPPHPCPTPEPRRAKP